MPGDRETLQERYRALIAKGDISDDSAQALAVEKLQLLGNRLARYKAPLRTDFFSFFTRRRGEVPKGIYMFGPVGRGKTMLMDLFYQAVPIGRKRRIHFHEFMADVHARLQAARLTVEGDRVLAVAARIAEEIELLCLDEFFVLDIADATILGRLFGAFFESGLVIVCTSNAAPGDLYKDGRNRDLFLPFIDLLEENMEVLQLEAVRDYRLGHLSKGTLYLTPANGAAKTAMDSLWRALTFGEPCREDTLTVLGHPVRVPCACLGAARFEFSDLCGKPLGAQDYRAIARHYHTVFVEGIPVMGRDRRDEARRFITLIDTLYDSHTGLVATADAEPGYLYTAGDGAGHFERTASRLIEMRSPEYLSKSRNIEHSALANGL